jgi:hypothetical protein
MYHRPARPGAEMICRDTSIPGVQYVMGPVLVAVEAESIANFIIDLIVEKGPREISWPHNRRV